MWSCSSCLTSLSGTVFLVVVLLDGTHGGSGAPQNRCLCTTRYCNRAKMACQGSECSTRWLLYGDLRTGACKRYDDCAFHSYWSGRPQEKTRLLMYVNKTNLYEPDPNRVVASALVICSKPHYCSNRFTAAVLFYRTSACDGGERHVIDFNRRNNISSKKLAQFLLCY